MYRLEPDGWEQIDPTQYAEPLCPTAGPISRDARDTGSDVQYALDCYSAWDYLDAEPPEFGSREDAQDWLATHDMGPDDCGVTARFRIAG